jgi:hypothetical protein
LQAFCSRLQDLTLGIGVIFWRKILGLLSATRSWVRAAFGFVCDALKQSPTGFHNGGPEHFGHMLCDDWGQSFADTSILFIESNQYFAAALRQNLHHVGASLAFRRILSSVSCMPTL